VTPKIITNLLPRLEKGTGIQITATIRPDLADTFDEPALRLKIERLIRAGTSHFRLNLSHFKPDDPNALKNLTRDEYESRWRDLVRCIDSVKTQLGVNIFIMLDTAGPEFRIARTSDGAKPLTALEVGSEYLLSGESDIPDFDTPAIYLTMPSGFISFGRGLLDREVCFKDGDCTAIVISQIRDTLLKIKVQHHLDLSRGYNIKANFPDFALEGIAPVSAQDREHLEFFLRIPRNSGTAPGDFIRIHYIAQSFVRAARDVADLAANLRTIKGHQNIDKPLLIPKIETSQAVAPDTLKAIIRDRETAAVMVARGDLGSELKRWKVASIQRQIIRVAHSFLKPVLVATEVYGSMGKYPKDAWQPNRGEVLDLRHALEAGVDGLVFSAETGAREDPETTVEFAVKQACEDEKDIEVVDLHKAEHDENEWNLDTMSCSNKHRELLSPWSRWIWTPWLTSQPWIGRAPQFIEQTFAELLGYFRIPLAAIQSVTWSISCPTDQ
jgi:pyruvate kinase